MTARRPDRVDGGPAGPPVGGGAVNGGPVGGGAVDGGPVDGGPVDGGPVDGGPVGGGAVGGAVGAVGGRSACVPGLVLRPLVARPGGRRRPADGRPRGRGGVAGRDRGSATAELAASMPALMVLVLAGVMAVSAAGTKIRCGSAARDAALAAARGEDGAAAAGRVAPDGASVRVSADGDLARATVSAQVRPFGNLLPAITVSGTAVAAVEPGPP